MAVILKQKNRSIDNGSAEAFRKIYEQTNRKIYSRIIAGAADRSDAEDIFQETYVDLFNALKAGREISEPEAYLMTIARRKLYAYYKQLNRVRKRETAVSEDENRDIDPDEMALENYSIEDSVVNVKLYEEISVRLREKPDITQRIFAMFYSLDMAIPEIAESLSVSESFVKNRLYRTLKEFRSLYGKEESL